jgi:hypothetical protein
VLRTDQTSAYPQATNLEPTRTTVHYTVSGFYKLFPSAGTTVFDLSIPCDSILVRLSTITMATDADIVPESVTDFVFDLYDSLTLSQLTEEQSRLYNTVFRELSSNVCGYSVQ